MPELQRCPWCGTDPLYVAYHDFEWGVPIYDAQALFELLILEGAQAGLSWITVLRKRDHYRTAFDNFDPHKIAHYDEAKQAQLLTNAGIIRNRLKIASVIKNAQAYLAMQEQGEDFSNFLWGFVGGKPLINQHKNLNSMPAATQASDAMSKALKKKGFKFVGSTICYAFMQASGMVNDHLIDCFKYPHASK